MSKFRRFLKLTSLSTLLSLSCVSKPFAAPIFLDTNTGKHASAMIDRDSGATPVSFPMAGHHALDFDPLGAVDRLTNVRRTIAKIDYWRGNGTILKSAILRAKDGQITSTLAGVRWQQLPMPELEGRLTERPVEAHPGFIEPVLRWNDDIRNVADVPGLFQGYFTEPAVVRCANGRVFTLTEIAATQPLLSKPPQLDFVTLQLGSVPVKIDNLKSGLQWHTSPTLAELDFTEVTDAEATGHKPANLAWGDLGKEAGNPTPPTSAYSSPVNNDSCDDDPLYFISEEDLPDYRRTFPLNQNGRLFSPFAPFQPDFGVSEVPVPHSGLLLISAFSIVALRRQKKKTV